MSKSLKPESTSDDALLELHKKIEDLEYATFKRISMLEAGLFKLIMNAENTKAIKSSIHSINENIRVIGSILNNLRRF